MNRRQFGAAMAALGLSSAAGGEPPSRQVAAEPLHLSRNGWCPNNDRLPVLWYHRAFNASSGDAVSAMESRFIANQWPPQWRNGIYRYHHFHSTAHEVLGFAAGWAEVTLGGEGGHNVRAEAGDVLVLPTGTGHCLISASPELLVIGAYPPGQQWDICRSAPDAAAIERMRTLPFPVSDPLSGASGALPRLWHT